MLILKACGKEQRIAEVGHLVSEMCSLGLELSVSKFDTWIYVFMFGQDSFL